MTKKDIKISKFLKEENVLLQEKNIITFLRDDSCNMICLELNSKSIMQGNPWDFHNGCYGGSFMLLPDFSSCGELAEILQSYMKKKGYTVIIESKEYDCYDYNNKDYA